MACAAPVLIRSMRKPSNSTIPSGASITSQITLTTPLPNTPNTIGTDGIQGDAGAAYTEIRVRVIDQAGKASSLSTVRWAIWLM